MITIGLGCLSHNRGRAGLPFRLCGRRVRQRTESAAKVVRLPLGWIAFA